MSSDTARDVQHEYMKMFNTGVSKSQIQQRLMRRWRSELSDSDEGPIVRLALAKSMWDCGHLSKSELAAAKSIVTRGLGLDLWRERGPKALARRRAKLQLFIRGLSTPNAKPKKPKKPTQRSPVFSPGDCLAIRLKSGRYAAAIVLHEPVGRVASGEETFGSNIIGQLRYLSQSKPTLQVFERREWLVLTHGGWKKNSRDGKGLMHVVGVDRLGFRAVAGQFEVVGKTDLRESDPSEAWGLWSWTFADQVELQMTWERRAARLDQ